MYWELNKINTSYQLQNVVSFSNNKCLTLKKASIMFGKRIPLILDNFFYTTQNTQPQMRNRKHVSMYFILCSRE